MARAMNTTKFTFDTVFGTDRDSTSERARSRRMLSETEVEKLVSQARAEGAAAEEAKALDAVAKGVREVERTMRETMARLAEDVESLRAESAAIALAAARKMAHAALACFPEGEVEAALRDAMHQAVGEPRIVLRAAPKVAEALAPRVAEIAHEEGYEGRVQIAADSALTGADCRIEWRGGGAERTEVAILAALDEVIMRRFQRQQGPSEG